MELGESTAEGAAREVWEEAQARVVIESLLGVYEIPHINQVNIIYRASMLGPDFAPGLESEAVALFAWEDIPWDQLAFPSVRWSLERFRSGSPPAVFAAAPPLSARSAAGLSVQRQAFVNRSYGRLSGMIDQTNASRSPDRLCLARQRRLRRRARRRDPRAVHPLRSRERRTRRALERLSQRLAANEPLRRDVPAGYYLNIRI